MQVLVNAIEDFAPEEFPLRQFRVLTKLDVEHQQLLDDLKSTRHRVCDMRSLELWDSIDKIHYNYAQLVYHSLSASKQHLAHALEDIDDAIFAEDAKLDAAYSCQFNCRYLLAKRQLKRSTVLLKANAQSCSARREAEIHEANELMNRQLIMHAFATSPVVHDVRYHYYNGVLQGHFEPIEILAWRLGKSPEDSTDGVYRLKLVWVPSRDATKIPARILIDRISEGRFDIQQIDWMSHTVDREEYDLLRQLRLPIRTVNITASIRCRVVAYDQCFHRVAKEKAEENEKQYKKSLPIWKRLTYKPKVLESAAGFSVEPF